MAKIDPETTKQHKYGADEIQVLEGLERGLLTRVYNLLHVLLSEAGKKFDLVGK